LHQRRDGENASLADIDGEFTELGCDHQRLETGVCGIGNLEIACRDDAAAFELFSCPIVVPDARRKMYFVRRDLLRRW
jgi:hypothetical protein